MKRGCLSSKFPDQPKPSTSTDLDQPLGTECKQKIKQEFNEEVTLIASNKNLISRVTTEENCCQSALGISSTDLCQPFFADWSRVKIKREYTEENPTQEIPTASKSVFPGGSRQEIKQEFGEETTSTAIATDLLGFCQPMVLKINRPTVKSEHVEETLECKPSECLNIDAISSKHEDTYNIQPEIMKVDKAIQAYITHKYRSKSTQTKIQKRTSRTSPIIFSKSVSTSPFTVTDLRPTFFSSRKRRKPAIIRSGVRQKL